MKTRDEMAEQAAIEADKVYRKIENVSGHMKAEAYSEGFEDGYRHGAKAEAERAKGLVDALEKIIPHSMTTSVMTEARKVLAEYKKGQDEK